MNRLYDHLPSVLRRYCTTTTTTSRLIRGPGSYISAQPTEKTPACKYTITGRFKASGLTMGESVAGVQLDVLFLPFRVVLFV